MATSTERDIIVEFALRDRDSLELTLDIVASYDKIRERVIARFLRELEESVSARQSEWKPRRPSPTVSFRPFEEQFSLSKESQSERYQIVIEAQKGDIRDVIVGVKKNKDTDVHIPDLRGWLDDKVKPNGMASAWWIWYQYLDQPLRNWTSKEALTRMNDGSAAKTLGDYVSRIMDWVNKFQR